MKIKILIRNVSKRTFDVLISTILILALSPIFLLISILVAYYLGLPVFFKQTRPGKGERLFTLYKFRTMTNQKDKDSQLLPNKDRLPRFGKLLRSTSLDELPELVNVLKGDMSLVGPRPLLTDYLPLYTNYQKQRHNVKPGITGWAQVNGRNSIKWEDKFILDVWYVTHQSLSLDLKILWLTFIKVMQREGIQHEGDITMPRFKGDQSSVSVK